MIIQQKKELVVLVQQIDNKEIWLPCVGYENKYMVSNLGRVKRLAYTYYYNNKTVHFNEKIKKQCESAKRANSKQGYLCTRLLDENGKSDSKMVHVLVAKAFIPNPNNLPTVNHIDGNKHNNRVDNLEWTSYSQNNQHAYDNQLKTDNQIIIQVKNGIIVNIFISINNASLNTIYSPQQIYKLLNTGKPDDTGCIWYRYKPNEFSIIKINN